MNTAPRNGSSLKGGRPQRSPRTLSSRSRQRRSSEWIRSRSWLAVAIAVFALLIGGAVIARDQQLQLQEAIHG